MSVDDEGFVRLYNIDERVALIIGRTTAAALASSDRTSWKLMGGGLLLEFTDEILPVRCDITPLH